MSLVARLGIAYPIIQAPMAGTSSPALAAAVSNAGGLGSIGVGAVDAAKARTMIRAIRERTSKPFNVNLFAHEDPKPDAARDKAWAEHLRADFERFGGTMPTTLKTVYPSFASDDAMLAMLLEEKPPVVSFHFGLPPAAAVKALKDAGAFLVASATSLDEAQACEAAGMDAIVAQGFEAGGHRGIFDPSAPDDCLPTLTLTRLLVSRCKVPIIAAGGIMDGRGIRAALEAGASAAQLGTAFILCPESDAPEAHRKALLGEPGMHTRLIAVVSGRLARCVGGRWTQIAEELSKQGKNATAIASYPNAYDAGKQLATLAASKGDYTYGAFWAGQGAPFARAMPAEELVKTLVEEMKTVSKL